MPDFQVLKDRIRKSRLINDSFWAIFGNVVGKGLSLLAAIIIARILGKEIYGEYGILLGTISSIVIFSNFGLNYTTTKYIAQYNKSKPELLPHIIKLCLNLTLIFSILCMVILLVFSEYVATHFFESPKLAVLLQLVALSIPFTSLYRTQLGIMAGFGEFKTMAKINTFIGIATFSVGISLTYFYGLLGALIASILLGIFNTLLCRYFIKKNMTANLVESKEKISVSEILNFSIPVALQEALWSIINYSYGLLLVKFSTYGEMGLHSAAMYWSAMVLFVPGILRNVVLSHLSASLDDNKRRFRILRIILFFNFITTFSIALVFYLFSGYIVSIYGSNFAGLKDVINIAMFTTVFISLSNVYSQAYMSENRNWLMLFFRIIRDLSILFVAYYLIVDQDGIEGALSLAKSTLWANIIFLMLMGGVYEYLLKRKSAKL